MTTCAGEDSFRFEPLRIVKRPDGLRGAIYDPKGHFSTPEGALAAVLNFPKSFHKNYEAVAFYFEDPTPLDIIETVLQLVKLGS